MANLNGLSKNDLPFFYDLTLYVEAAKRNGYKGKNLVSKETKLFLQENKINLSYKGKVGDTPRNNTIEFTKRGNILFCLLKHIRNAFAHGRIHVEGRSYIMQDANRGHLTMCGKINQKHLKDLFDFIKNKN